MVFKKHLKLKAYSLQLKAGTLLLATLFNLVICVPCYAEFYRYNIDELARKAKVRIKEIEEKIGEEQAAGKLQEVLSEANMLYDRAEALFQERRYEEALAVYNKIERMSQDPNITKWLDREKLFKGSL